MQPSAANGTRHGALPNELWIQAERILRFSRVVSDLGRAESFYSSALSFRPVSRGAVDQSILNALGVGQIRANEVSMRIGREEISLVQFASPGVSDPLDSRSNDLWFQHLAIVVTDMQAAYDHLRANNEWHAISTQGPQRLPESGEQAFKFRDPDGHPLELLWLPPERRRGVWQGCISTPGAASLFLGIDHSALAVSSTRRSLAFYRALGMRPGDRSLNVGPAQARLDGLPSARVKVTGLRPASPESPGLELLAYQPPGRSAAASKITDLSTDWITLAAITASASPGMPVNAAGACAPRMLIDPDGHRVLLTDAPPAR
jgi:catechol 2,3-dioxygenase-like lactoylglutathione lyase family enzyme